MYKGIMMRTKDYVIISMWGTKLTMRMMMFVLRYDVTHGPWVKGGARKWTSVRGARLFIHRISA